MARLKQILAGVVGSFGPLVLFVLAEHLLDLRWAIGLCTAYTALEVALRKARHQRLDTLFLFSAVMSLAFGAIDLVVQQPMFIKYEAVGTNILTGIFFGGTVFSGRPLIQEFYSKSPDAKPITPELASYFRGFTLVWAAYFFAKAGVYAYLASRYDFDHALAFRAVLGNGSMLVMLVVSIGFGRQLFRVARRLGLVRVPEEPLREP